MLSRSKVKRHRRKAGIFLGLGAILAVAPAVGLFFETDRSRVWIWYVLFIGTLPAVAWGASHLARFRGYPSEAGFVLSFVGYLVSGVLGTTSPHPLVLSCGVLFIVLLPPIILLSIPSKTPIYGRRGR
jgi:hypothetical protein